VGGGGGGGEYKKQKKKKKKKKDRARIIRIGVHSELFEMQIHHSP